MAQIIKIKGNKTNANATPSSLVERELASNLVDRCLFGSDGTSVFKYYTGSTKYFDANGYANNANKLGGQTIDYFASADGVADALDEIIDSLKGYQPLITSTNKLAYSLISGVPTSLKNPNALTINNSAGTAQVSYDGSAVKSLTLTKAMVGLGNVENTALSTWVGTNKITTLGTITTGVWNGTKIANGYLANSAITIAGTSVSLGGSITAATLQSNLGLGSFAYKSSLAFSELTDKPTTLGGYGITDWSVTFGDYDVNRRYDAGYYIITNGSNAPTHANYGSLLVMPYRKASGNTIPDFGTQIFLPNGDDSGYPNDMFFRTSLGSSWNAWQRVLTDNNYTYYTYSKSTIDTKLGGYLPLSGGTIEIITDEGLSVNRTNGTRALISFKVDGGYKGGIGIDTDGVPLYRTYTGGINTLIHSGNIGSQSVDNADKLDGYHAKASNTPFEGIPVVRGDGVMEIGKYIDFHNDNTSGNDYDCRLDIQGGNGNIVHLPSTSGILALLTDNVASATKLQTSRSIWGQSFDGTAAVTGAAMGLGGAIDFQFSDEINRYGGTLYLQHRGDGSKTGTGSGATGNVVMCYRGGNVGIGINDVQYKLDVNGTLHASGMVIFDSALNVASSCRLMGNVGIGVNADDNKLCVYGVIRSAAYNAKGNNNAAFVFDKQGSNYTGIGANGVADTIYFGACSTTGAWVTDYYQKWHFNGEVYAKTGIWSDGYVSAKGQNTSSDMRLKNVLNNVVLRVKDIANAPSVRFSWKNGGGVDVGSSAQYWQGLLPDAVKERDGMLEMQYANIALLSAIAIAKNVETHEERIARLEKENKELRNEINSLRYGA